MGKLLIENTGNLSGEVLVQGAKNSALPILAATILCDDICIIGNCPGLSDVNATIDILKSLGAKVKKEEDNIIVDSTGISNYKISKEMMTKMRSSILFLGAIASRLGKVNLYFPGGCELGPRPIDWHIKALSQMGLNIQQQDDILVCKAENRLKGTKISLPLASVGTTENIILAAVLAEGTTIIENAAREPEICDLCSFLVSCGAKIFGAGESRIEIFGVNKLHGAEHKIIPDRIVAATFMAAAASAGGKIVLKNVAPEHLRTICDVFKTSGCNICCRGREISIESSAKLKSIGRITTMPYPGFPTDAQALVMAMSTLADGTSEFIENLFENRYRHVDELLKLGADIKISGKKAYVKGVKNLYGNNLKAKDLRGAAALAVAALSANGESVMEGLEYLDRGYENFELSFRNIGANIKRI